MIVVTHWEQVCNKYDEWSVLGRLRITGCRLVRTASEASLYAPTLNPIRLYFCRKCVQQGGRFFYTSVLNLGIEAASLSGGDALYETVKRDRDPRG